MNYYILYPNQSKDNIDYQEQLAAVGGMSTIYLKYGFNRLMDRLEEAAVNDDDGGVSAIEEIVIFNERGKEWSVGGFLYMIGNEYKFVKKE